MRSDEHMARCQAMRGGVTESEAAIISDLQAAERSRDELARWVVEQASIKETEAKPFHVIWDFACNECDPGGSMVKSGFRCDVHEARALLSRLDGGQK